MSLPLVPAVRTFSLLLVLLSVLAGCGPAEDESGAGGYGSIAVRAVWPGDGVRAASFATGSMPAEVQTVRFIVTGPGMNPMQKDFAASARQGAIDGVPVGADRTLTMQAFDVGWNKLFEGSRTGLTVTTGVTTNAGDVAMEPPISEVGNLVAHYLFDGDTLDYAGSAHGYLVGNPAFVPGTTGQAIHISQDNYVRIPSESIYKPAAGDFAISLDFNVNNESSTLITYQGGDFAEGIVLRIVYSPDPEIVIIIQPEAYYGGQVVSAPIIINGWHNIVAVLDRKNNLVKLYIDGSLKTCVALSVTGSIDPTWDMLIGAYEYSSARNGLPKVVSGNVIIDNVKIYGNGNR